MVNIFILVSRVNDKSEKLIGRERVLHRCLLSLALTGRRSQLVCQSFNELLDEFHYICRGNLGVFTQVGEVSCEETHDSTR